MRTGQTTALVTGGNRGLGRQTVLRLAQMGWRVFLGARDRERGRDAAQQLTSVGLAVEFVQLDVTDNDSVLRAAREVGGVLTNLDVLVNNAGVGGAYRAPQDTTIEDFESVYSTNVYGPVRVTNAFLPLLRQSANPRVVMVSSGMGSIARCTDPSRIEYQYGDLVYTSSKAALNMITVQYARALPSVKFNVADPGLTATDFSGGSAPQSVEEGTDAIIRLSTLGPDGPSGQFLDRHGVVPW